jgi:hypothetical protein
MIRNGEIPPGVTHLTLVNNQISDLSPIAS